MTVVSMLSRVMFAAVAVAGIAGIATVHAQQPSGPPNALQGFSQNHDKPIKINSATLEVRDKDKMATFAGDVHLVQGDTTLRSKTLVVFYGHEVGIAQNAAPANAATSSDSADNSSSALPECARSPDACAAAARPGSSQTRGSSRCPASPS